MRAVAAACLACALAAQAAPVSVPVSGSFTATDPAGSGRSVDVRLTGGTGSWELSNGGWTEQLHGSAVGGFVFALDVLNAKVVGVEGIQPAEQFWTDPDNGHVYRTGVQVPTQVASVALDNATGQITSISNVGSVQIKGARISGTLAGGIATISNLRFDLVNKSVVADLSGVRSAVGTIPSASYNLPGATLWTFASITGPRGVPVDALMSTNPAEAVAAAGFDLIDGGSFASTLTISGLSLSSAGYGFLVDALGLGTTGRNAVSGVGQQGSIQTRLVFSTAVPEPSTYALLGVGLVGICVGLRRRVAAF